MLPRVGPAGGGVPQRAHERRAGERTWKIRRAEPLQCGRERGYSPRVHPARVRSCFLSSRPLLLALAACTAGTEDSGAEVCGRLTGVPMEADSVSGMVYVSEHGTGISEAEGGRLVAVTVTSPTLGVTLHPWYSFGEGGCSCAHPAAADFWDPLDTSWSRDQEMDALWTLNGGDVCVQPLDPCATVRVEAWTVTGPEGSFVISGEGQASCVFDPQDGD